MKLPEQSEMTRTVISYTALRLALFTIVFLGLLFTPLPRLAAFGIALLGSAVLSYPLGRQQRDRMAELLAERRERRPTR